MGTNARSARRMARTEGQKARQKMQPKAIKRVGARSGILGKLRKNRGT